MYLVEWFENFDLKNESQTKYYKASWLSEDLLIKSSEQGYVNVIISNLKISTMIHRTLLTKLSLNDKFYE
jgi:hypothetical protein